MSLFSFLKLSLMMVLGVIVTFIAFFAGIYYMQSESMAVSFSKEESKNKQPETFELKEELTTVKNSSNQLPQLIYNHSDSSSLKSSKELNNNIQEIINSYPEKTIQVVFYDINKDKILLNIKGDEPILAASLIKLLVLSESLNRKKLTPTEFTKSIPVDSTEKVKGSGLLQYTPSTDRVNLNNLNYLMITKSDNMATNMLIKYLGKDNINHWGERLRLHHTDLRNPLMRVDLIGQTCTITQCNTTSPIDVTKLLLELYKSDEAKFILSHQEDRDAIPWVFQYDPELATLNNKVTIYNKTGSLSDLRSDAALIQDGTQWFILVITVYHTNKEEGNNIIHQISLPILHRYLLGSA